jgi:hypothetical protein
MPLGQQAAEQGPAPCSAEASRLGLGLLYSLGGAGPQPAPNHRPLLT